MGNGRREKGEERKEGEREKEKEMTTVWLTLGFSN